MISLNKIKRFPCHILSGPIACLYSGLKYSFADCIIFDEEKPSMHLPFVFPKTLRALFSDLISFIVFPVSNFQVDWIENYSLAHGEYSCWRWWNLPPKLKTFPSQPLIVEYHRQFCGTQLLAWGLHGVFEWAKEKRRRK